MIILGNGTVLTLNGALEIIEDGAVLIEEEKIKDVGKTTDLRRDYPAAVYKDVSGKIIMPGMINTHMHLYSTFARGMDLKTQSPPRNFIEILRKLWWRLDNTLNEDDIYYSAISALGDCIKKGTTTIFDHHASYSVIDGSLDIIAEAVEAAGLRANLAFEVSDRHGHKKALEAIRENERFLNNSRDKNFLGGTIGLHASFTLEDKTLERVSTLADELNIPCHLHTAEDSIDSADSQLRGWQGVAERLDSFQILRPATLAVHGVHLQAEELKILSENGCYLIHNPASNMGNGVGAAPVKKLFASGVKVGLGTDGFTADMFASMKTANLLVKHEEKDPQAGGDEVNQMSFINNREIAGQFFKRRLGIIEPGAEADLIIVNYYPPTPLNQSNLYSHLLSGVSGDMVDTTIVGGRILMEDQEVKILDYEQIQRRVREQAGDFWRRF